MFAKMASRAWANNKLTEQVYRACSLNTLFYASEQWCSEQELAPNTFHVRCLRIILGITWEGKVSNSTELDRADNTSMFTLLKQRCMCWLSDVSFMTDDQILKDLLFGGLLSGKRQIGRPQMHLQA